MMTTVTDSVTSSDDILGSSSAGLRTSSFHDSVPMGYLQNSWQLTSNDNILTDVCSWDELVEIDHVERVLTPLSVTIITVSNATLLLHEARLVWRTRRLIPPKLLVLVLSLADLLATVLGYLPLWILFVTPIETTDSHRLPTQIPPFNQSLSLLTNEPGFLGLTTESGWQEMTEQSVVSPTANNNSFVDRQQHVVQTLAYSMALVLLTSFWTLAQCTVVVMGIERFLTLRAPYFYAARCTCVAFLVVVGVLTLVSCGIGGFHLVVHLAEVKDHLMVFAGFLDSHSLAFNVYTLVQGLVWTLVLLLCNWAVTRELRRMERSVTVMRMKDQNEYMKQLSMVHGAGREFARFMMAVNIIFLLSFCPNLVCVMLRLSNMSPRFSIQYFCWRMSHISAVLNPFLYGFLRKSLRSRLRRFLNQRVPCLRPQRVADDSEDPGPSVRYENRSFQRQATPNSVIMPRDPEASLVYFSE